MKSRADIYGRPSATPMAREIRSKFRPYCSFPAPESTQMAKRGSSSSLCVKVRFESRLNGTFGPIFHEKLELLLEGLSSRPTERNM
jgi:hypothetical protein